MKEYCDMAYIYCHINCSMNPANNGGVCDMYMPLLVLPQTEWLM